jgi:predicted  nucleic acid-binding Zn ribbon protein
LNSLQKIQNELNDLNYVISKHNRAKDTILDNIKDFDKVLKSNITTNIGRLMNYIEKVESIRNSLAKNINEQNSLMDFTKKVTLLFDNIKIQLENCKTEKYQVY